ncbi:keratin-associated protein 4-3-like isoform X1 [Mizuhopecten yessoensis]|uniref:keratin-associated protein 4-3-like isoform X1 n=1 Tax=Mizuhopecten yessoensis TaxID=6573 RepID=UPI000B45D499|nr:keratin-associated protein 4-3-like isoform X1 [Mizuhopecten yessoensis]
MVNMYLICLVSVLTLAVVQCGGPDCSPSSCAAPKTCQWTCKKSGNEISGATVTTCTNADDTCGNVTVTDGQCKPACKCGTATCSATQSCDWNCTHGGNVIPNADVTSCSASAKTCNSTGTCVAACLRKPTHQPSIIQIPIPTTDKHTEMPRSGFIKHGLSPLVLMCGILAKLYLSL